MATIKITGLTKEQADAFYDAAEFGTLQDKLNDILGDTDVDSLMIDVLDEKEVDGELEYLISTKLLEEEDEDDDADGF